MKVGQVLIVVRSFKKEENDWGIQYPKKNDLLIVSHIEKHHIKKCKYLLYFEGNPLPFPLAYKTYKGKHNFRKVKSISINLK
jgi:hypothetical protein